MALSAQAGAQESEGPYPHGRREDVPSVVHGELKAWTQDRRKVVIQFWGTPAPPVLRGIRDQQRRLRVERDEAPVPEPGRETPPATLV